MLAYIGSRLVQAVPVLLLASIVIFGFIRLIPGDPALALAGQNATPEQVAALRERFGLDEPITTQYLTWVGQALRGDLGFSYITDRPVRDLISQRIPATLQLAGGSILVMLVVGAPLGVFTAVRPNSALARLVSVLNAVALATPTFWLGLLLILYFSVSRKLLPASGYVTFTDDPVEAIKHLLLPALTLGAYGTAVLIRFLNASLTDALKADYIRVAYAKGLRERAVVLRHGLKVALPPVITILAIQFGQLLGGAVVTESVFGWPGLGRLILDAISNRDYLVVQSTMLLFVITFVLLNILADVGYALLNPRIRLAR
ncbi:MAG: ABC transporter permease [Thermomicrobiales bacterium]|nr:ABC transporter permease [Thermomicrobiales bacterium]